MSVLRVYARYNVWATEQLWKSCKSHPDLLLSPQASHGLFASSIHGTFTHILLADALWYYRINKSYPRYVYDIFGLKEEKSLSNRLASLWSTDECSWCTIVNTSGEVETYMRDQGAQWLKLLDSYSDKSLSTSLISYADTSGVTQSQRLENALLHVFNHSTHHRGQITAVLSSHHLPIPPLDFTYYLSSVASDASADKRGSTFNDSMMI